MFRGFNVTLPAEFKDDEWLITGRREFDNHRKEIVDKLDSFMMPGNILSADKMRADWFPEINADVFISHSHDNEDLAITLAGALKTVFDLDCFVDSCVWGYSNNLLSLLDKKYCFDADRKVFDYDRRNRTTSHVHMMLTMALARMIYKSEAIFFLNTPQSITPADTVVGSSGMTLSPWIYCEIAMTQLIGSRAPQEHRRVIMEKALAKADSMKIAYDVDLGHLTPLSLEDIVAWDKEFERNNGHSLDALYAIK